MSGQWCGSCGRLVTDYDEACPACGGTSRRVVAPTAVVPNVVPAPRAPAGRTPVISTGVGVLVVLLVATVAFAVTRSPHEPPLPAMTIVTPRSVSFPSTAPPTTYSERYPGWPSTPPPDTPIENPVSRWTTVLPPGPVANGRPQPRAWMGPYVVGDTVLVFTWEPRLMAFDARTGSEIWQIKVGTDPRSNSGVDTFTGRAAGSDTFVVSDGGRLLALDVHDGGVRWQASTERGAPFGADETRVVYPAKGRIVSVDALTGAHRWDVDARMAESAAIVALTPSLVVLSSSGSVRGLDATSGVERWFEHPDVFGTALTSASSNAIWLGDLHGNIVQLDPADGSERWQKELGGSSVDIREMRTEDDGTGIIRTASSLIAISRSGNELWRSTVGSFEVRPVLTDDELIAPTPFGILVSDLVSGTPRLAWMLDPKGPIYSKPAVTDDAVIVIVNGALVAYPRP